MKGKSQIHQINKRCNLPHYQDIKGMIIEAVVMSNFKLIGD